MMPDIYLQIIDEIVQNPSPDEGEITLDCRAWHAPGQYIGLTAYFDFSDTPEQMAAKVRSAVVYKCSLESVTVESTDKVIMARSFTLI